MAGIALDRVTTLNLREKNGVVMSLTRVARIIGLPKDIDYTVLLDAYAQAGLPTPGSFLTTLLPFLNPPTILSPGAYGSTAMLVLAEREFDLVDGEPTAVDCKMHYQHFMEGNLQNLSPSNSRSPGGWIVPSSVAVYGRSRASVTQTKSNFYNGPTRTSVGGFGRAIQQWVAGNRYAQWDIVQSSGFFWQAAVGIAPLVFTTPPAPQALVPNPQAQVPPPGPVGYAIGQLWNYVPPDSPLLNQSFTSEQQIVVGHQFPGPGPNLPFRNTFGPPFVQPAGIPGVPDITSPGQTKTQTGEITVMQPNENFKLQGQIFTTNPRAVKIALLTAINSVPWMDEDAFTWMCVEVSYEPLYVAWQWSFSFEFQHNPDTWLPTPIFNDQRIGRPPPGLLPGFGYRQIHYHPEVDFEKYFNKTFGSAPMSGQ
jgi:hypothetical protein